MRGGQWPDRHSSPRSLVNAGETLKSEIVTQLPYIKKLLNGRDKAQICTQRISLVWQLEEEGDWGLTDTDSGGENSHATKY